MIHKKITWYNTVDPEWGNDLLSGIVVDKLRVAERVRVNIFWIFHFFWPVSTDYYVVHIDKTTKVTLVAFESIETIE